MPTPALEVRGLRKTFPKFTLGPLDLTVPEGALYGFVGPNGAGKTTTIDLLFGMGGKDAGAIKVLGLDHLEDEVAMKAQFGYVSPELTFLPWRTVRRAIDFVRGFHPTWDQTLCDRLCETFGLDQDGAIRTLSFGTRTKLSLVLALAWRPRLLILDEPTVGLDAISKRQVFAELLAAVNEEGRTVFISSHAIADLERFADHVGMIKDGRLLFEGRVDTVTDRYRIVDVMVDTADQIAEAPGIVVQHREGPRWRVLVDSRATPLEALERMGARLVSESSLSLEDLFVAIGRS